MDVEKFKHGMRRLASGVSLITTVRDGQRHGLTATAVSSVSAAPPSLLVCVAQSASAHDAIVAAGKLCVNILSAQQETNAMRFGRSDGRDSRFEHGNWQTLKTGAPALAGSLATFDCEVRQTIPYTSHSILICEIVDVALWDTPLQPLVYFNSAFVQL
ncbi:flavin reductase family protein [Verticiella sediminum]|uniref:Flavin reductase family protein n=2 Tax=Verticiella sediminum TaxID=1247510 RepID=A0A556AJR2_9BURK|nr:flavin reductase family protein [Verticiella sediminum]